MGNQSGLGLYVHWPFCQAKCPYCDFNSHVVSNVDQTRWLKALQAEIKRSADEIGPRRLDTIFFGGGTPSLMKSETVAGVIESAVSTWAASESIEITLEANPTSSEASRFRDYAAAGVNRVSVGVQALNDADLKALGRLHDVTEALAAVETAREVFPRVSYDLIYARQNQTLEAWIEELNAALNTGPDHLSLYQLTIENGTAFGDRFKRGKLAGLPEEDLSADMFDATQEITSAAGLPSYEVSNHAKPGKASRHNLIYWQSGDWVGVGPGAHGRITTDQGRIATETHLAPGEWLSNVETTGSGESKRESLTVQDCEEELLMMGLRLSAGLPIRSIPKKYHNKINILIESGHLETTSDHIRTTAQGKPLLNTILREILA